MARIGWAIFQLEALELARQSAYIRSRSRNTKILSTFSTGQHGARNEHYDVNCARAKPKPLIKP